MSRRRERFMVKMASACCRRIKVNIVRGKGKDTVVNGGGTPSLPGSRCCIGLCLCMTL